MRGKIQRTGFRHVASEFKLQKPLFFNRPWSSQVEYSTNLYSIPLKVSTLCFALNFNSDFKTLQLIVYWMYERIRSCSSSSQSDVFLCALCSLFLGVLMMSASALSNRRLSKVQLDQAFITREFYKERASIVIRNVTIGD